MECYLRSGSISFIVPLSSSFGRYRFIWGRFWCASDGVLGSGQSDQVLC